MGPVPLDIPTSLLLGLLFAAAGQRLLTMPTPPWGPTLRAMSTLLVVRIPTALYLQSQHPHWSWLYAADPTIRPLLFAVAVAAAHGAALGAGCMIGAALLRRFPGPRGRRILAASATLLGGLLLLAALLLRSRLAVDGSAEDQAAGTAALLREGTLRVVLPAVLLGNLIAFLGPAWVVWSQGRRLVLWPTPPRLAPVDKPDAEGAGPA